ncbi:MAG TPA: hypothetical protein VF559_08280 [Caulobacteraceae bacterium]|jgi:hypothetical protein
MSMSEMIPRMNDDQLATLRGNAVRLEQSGTGKQRTDAAELLPLIAAEVAERIARKPAPVKKARVKKVKAAA